jgi:hypothetical protein
MSYDFLAKAVTLFTMLFTEGRGDRAGWEQNHFRNHRHRPPGARLHGDPFGHRHPHQGEGRVRLLLHHPGAYDGPGVSAIKLFFFIAEDKAK